jgi:hypothetical protein
VLLLGELWSGDGVKIDPRKHLAEVARLGARKPFLTDSPDVYLEPKSLNRFFTMSIYRRLQGNAYFGYDFDEGFVFEGNAVQIEVPNDLTPGTACRASYRLALEQTLAAAGLEVKPTASCQIGICNVGVEPRETPKTLPGVMVEAYLRNARQKKSFFIRYGASSPRGLPSALRASLPGCWSLIWIPAVALFATLNRNSGTLVSRSLKLACMDTPVVSGPAQDEGAS